MKNQKALRLLKKYYEHVKIELSNNLEANIDRLAEGYWIFIEQILKIVVMIILINAFLQILILLKMLI